MQSAVNAQRLKLFPHISHDPPVAGMNSGQACKLVAEKSQLNVSEDSTVLLLVSEAPGRNRFWSDM